VTTVPIVLVPGFWLGAWAWDEVAAALRADGHDVTAVTLPGLASADADRSAITLSDHVDAICDVVKAAATPVVLAVHSGAGASGYAASDRVSELIAAMVYVDSGPATGALEPDFDGVEKPLPSREELEEEENLDGLSEEQLETFRRRAVPEPGGVLREAPGADQRRTPRRAEHGRVHGVPVRADQGRRRGGLCVAQWSRRAARRHLDRPADEPLADVVAPPGARRDHRRRRESSRPRHLAASRSAAAVNGRRLLPKQPHAPA